MDQLQPKVSYNLCRWNGAGLKDAEATGSPNEPECQAADELPTKLSIRTPLLRCMLCGRLECRPALLYHNHLAEATGSPNEPECQAADELPAKLSIRAPLSRCKLCGRLECRRGPLVSQSSCCLKPAHNKVLWLHNEMLCP